MGCLLEWLDPEDINCKMAVARKSGTNEEAILIPRRGGMFDGKPFKCFRSVYDTLREGQLLTTFCRVNLTFVSWQERADVYCLQKDKDNNWELVWTEARLGDVPA